jgi:hypothetical protein
MRRPRLTNSGDPSQGPATCARTGYPQATGIAHFHCRGGAFYGLDKAGGRGTGGELPPASGCPAGARLTARRKMKREEIIRNATLFRDILNTSGHDIEI